ncbi:FKBP-type peptidyl-prolyl cis-trans isomerase [Candidatus Azobacteroides pseudotrichonymphae]|uniref:peptidylprolyl isomerase n=1 Tax=Azobacteroides pseudotrichonymphae genomovar. CFP2 TaxID=511995 RepID=B6YQC9_AZOPC|nr:FKBP-type peptidyl-prolyl cis-trans isomerase [Candidatus Azobacteroides pseudotrichonymphae]BAG83401.1 putative peptidylprolyl isomerase [Candidatus Azobacteroides pseudotrichonymphae genomovar. CFP2]
MRKLLNIYFYTIGHLAVLVNNKKKLLAIFCSLFFLLLVILAFALFFCKKQITKVNLRTNIDSVSYAQGVLYAYQVKDIFTQLKLDETNRTDFIRGFQEGFRINSKNKKENAFVVGKMIGYQIGTLFIPYFNERLFGDDSTQTMSRENLLAGYISTVKNDSSTLFTKEEARTYSVNTIESIRKNSTEKRYRNIRRENLDFLEKNKSNKGVIVLSSGLQYKVIKEKEGRKPMINDVVRIDYRGTNIKGEVFDSSIESGEPVEFSLNNKEVIEGWKEGIRLMSVGSKYIFYIPYYLAYGDQYKGDIIVPYSTLIFEVELREIVKKTKSNGKN